MVEAISAVLNDPWNDAARSDFATVVEPSDPARAELVRLQLRLAHTRRRGGQATSEWRGDYARVQTLLRSHGARWTPKLPIDAATRFGRGFVEGLGCPASTYLAHARSIRDATPLLDLVLQDVASEQLGSVEFEGLRSLDLRSNKLDDQATIALANSPHLGQLRWLDLSGNNIGRAGLEALAASPNLPALKWLGFARNEASDPTPQVAEEHGVVHFVELPEAGRTLQSKHGTRAWLARPYPELAYPDPETYHS